MSDDNPTDAAREWHADDLPRPARKGSRLDDFEECGNAAQDITRLTTRADTARMPAMALAAADLQRVLDRHHLGMHVTQTDQGPAVLWADVERVMPMPPMPPR